MEKNPFAVINPEAQKPEDIASLYVDVIEDMTLITSDRHTFIHGARGTGKSMLLRYLEPRVQIAAEKYATVSELPFFAIHIPLKKGSFIYELQRLKGDMYNYFAEHFLVSLILAKTFMQIDEISPDDEYARNFYSNFLKRRLELLGHSSELDADPISFEHIAKIFEELNIVAAQYLKRHWDKSPSVPYDGPLFGYNDLLLPALKECLAFDFMPNGPFFLMLDDADKTQIEVQKIINTWVSYRTNEVVALKIATQLEYQTHSTVTGTYIEDPHDFCEIDLTTIYSPTTSNFTQRIRSILEKRFKIHSLSGAPDDFFPKDIEQEKAILKIADDLKEKHRAGQGKGHRESDDVVRYARPTYMASLTGTKKASSTFSYAGFDSIATLANGIIRWFLEPASLMYNKQKTLNDTKEVTEISVHVQDEILLAWSQKFIMEGNERLQELINSPSTDESQKNTALMLLKLIEGLGRLFRKILLSDLAERRVFSIMLSTEPDDELAKVLSMGVKWGFLQFKYIGTKEGLGRNPQYILSRRLAPFYKLDVYGFAGNLSVTAETLKIACHDPDGFVRARFAEKSSSQEQLRLI